MNIRQLFESFSHAARGVGYVYAHEQNFRIQLFFGFLSIAGGLFFQISPYAWVALLFTILAVLILELVNSAVEALSDVLKPRLNLHVALAKDIMAGAVFVASLGACALGAVIFLPYVIELFA